jgi:hypothetical protein
MKICTNQAIIYNLIFRGNKEQGIVFMQSYPEVYIFQVMSTFHKNSIENPARK